MDLIRIEGVPPFDGDYELDLGNFFNGDELHFIKLRSGVRAGELEDAFRAGDWDVMLCLAVIALRRSGRDVNAEAVDAIWKAEAGKIQFVAGKDEQSPPGSPLPNAEEENADGSEKNGSSGSDLKPGSVLPASDPSPTGQPLSERSAT